MSRKTTVYVDQEQDDDEQYLQSWIVYWDGDTEPFDDHASALQYAEELADENNLTVVDNGVWD